MKNYFYLMPVIFFFLLSCDKDDNVIAENQSFIGNIAMLEATAVQEAQEIEVTVHKGTPCHTINEVIKTNEGKTFDYNFIIKMSAEVCAQVITEEIVTVNFDPASSGEYTLKFFINGILFETRTVSVTE